MRSKAEITELIPDKELEELRDKVRSVIQRRGTPEAVAKLTQRVSDASVKLQGSLIDAWATWASDPAAKSLPWIWSGAPAGISADFDLDGVLEPVTDEQTASVDTLECDCETFSNYSGVEQGPEALAIVEGYIRNGWLSEFESLAELQVYVSGKPALNKVACITKQRIDGTMK
jgi:hypothetical protein